MEWLIKFLEIVKTLGDVGVLVALVIAAIFFSRPAILDRLPFLRKKQDSTTAAIALTSSDPSVMKALMEISTAMSKLQSHFNDETTAVLTDIQTTLAAMQVLLTELVETIGRQDIAIREIKQTQREMMKYGIPSRGKATLSE